MPVRNEAATLEECLASIRAQTLADWELVAVDDGSDDATPALLRAAAEADARVRVLSPGRVGLVAALNLGVQAARADLMARMDADDRMHPERLRAQHDFLGEHPGIELVASQVELFPEDAVQGGYREYVRWQNTVLTPDDVAANLYREAPFAHPSVMLRRSVLTRVGGYAEGPFPEDYELWLRLHVHGCRMAKLPRVLLWWRERPGRASRVDPRYARGAFDRLRARFLARDARVRGEREVVVWGAGRRTRLRARLLLDAGVRVAAWVDIDPRKVGARVGGLPVHPREWLARTPLPFVLVYVNSRGARELIATTLGGMGYVQGRDYLDVG